MVAIYDKTGGPQWTNCKDSRLDPCGCGYKTGGHRGIKCGTDGARVTSMDLVWNKLRGPLPEELWSLTGLSRLYLSDNLLNGSIPPNISALIGLTHLAMDGNRLLNGIPESISALTGLITLDLKLNRFTGPVPALPFKQYAYCSLQDAKNPSNHFTCPLPLVSATRLPAAAPPRGILT